MAKKATPSIDATQERRQNIAKVCGAVGGLPADLAEVRLRVKSMIERAETALTLDAGQLTSEQRAFLTKLKAKLKAIDDTITADRRMADEMDLTLNRKPAVTSTPATSFWE